MEDCAAPLLENVDSLALDLEDAAIVVGLPGSRFLTGWLADFLGMA
jgi:hypothetical protein